MSTCVTIAHRGASEKTTENSLAAFRLALAEGAAGLELDLRRTRDGHIVAMHDDTIDRTTSGSGAVADIDLAQLQSLPLTNGETAPTLATILAFIAGAGLRWVFFELKAPGLQDAVVAAAQDAGVGDICYVFNELEAARLDEQQGLLDGLGIARGSALAYGAADPSRRAVLTSYLLVDDSVVSRARAAGMPVFPGVDGRVNKDADRLRTVAATGAAGIITDDPLSLARALGERGA